MKEHSPTIIFIFFHVFVFEQEHKITFEGFAKMTEKDLDQVSVIRLRVWRELRYTEGPV